jgi:hypothetical protein
MGRREYFLKGVQEGQIPLFFKGDQPRLNTPDEVRNYLRSLIGKEVDRDVVAVAAKHDILNEIEHELDPARLARLKALLKPD